MMSMQLNVVVYDGSDAILWVEMMEGDEFQQFCGESTVFKYFTRATTTSAKSETPLFLQRMELNIIRQQQYNITNSSTYHVHVLAKCSVAVSPAHTYQNRVEWKDQTN